MKKIIRFVIWSLSFTFYIFTSAVLLTGCSNPFGGDKSKIDSGHAPGIDTVADLPSSNGSEFVNMSSQSVLTNGGRFRVSASVGSTTNEVKMVTTSRGYKIYSNIQGDLISEE